MAGDGQGTLWLSSGRKDGGEAVEVKITLPLREIQGVSSNLTAGKVWPACIVLAHFLLYHQNFLKGKVLFEFGSGIAVPSLAALKAGHVKSAILQELHIEALLAMQRAIFTTNELSAAPPTMIQLPLRWGQFPTDCPTDVGLFIAADCLYEKNDFADLVATVAYLLDRNPGVPFVMCYQDRNLLYSIDELFEHWGLKSELIPLQSFAFDAESFIARNDAGLVDEFPVEDIDKVLVMLEIRKRDEPFVFAI